MAGFWVAGRATSGPRHWTRTRRDSPTPPDGIRQSAAFGEPEQWRFDWERSYTRDEWLEQVPTFGGHSQFPPGRLDELLADIGSAIDAEGGSFTMEYAAIVVTATRIGDRRR
jgi:hypothetical protein